MKRPITMALAALLIAFGAPADGQTRESTTRPARPGKPPADVRDAVYGPHPRNVLDLWRADAPEPTRRCHPSTQ